VMANFTVSTTI